MSVIPSYGVKGVVGDCQFSCTETGMQNKVNMALRSVRVKMEEEAKGVC